MSALHLSQDGARTPNLEILECQVKAGAQVGRLTYRFEPAVGILGEGLVDGMKQVGIGALIRTADPPSQLIELGQTQQVGPLDDECVDLRQIQAGLDDGRCNQHVVLTIPEIEHDLLELSFTHLSVGDRESGVRHQLTQMSNRAFDRLHSIVNEEHLAFTEHLASDGGCDRLLVVRSDVGEDRVAVAGRGADVGDLPHSCQRHFEGARNGRSRQRQHIDPHIQLLQLVLGSHPEALLFVDDHETQVGELDVA